VTVPAVLSDRDMRAGRMKAFVCRQYGAPELADLPKPEITDGEVLVRVHAGGLNILDWYLTSGKPHLARLMAGVLKPRGHVVGTDFSGRVAAVGTSVTSVAAGDAVFGARRGSFAEYIAVPAARVTRKPGNLTFEEAAAVPVAALTALQGLQNGLLRAGERVLINGASGGIGTFAVQIAKALGAHVTGVCSTRNLDLVRSLGADKVIDYTREDFAHDQRYDVIVDIVGGRSWSEYCRALNPGGRFVMVGAKATHAWIGPLGHVAAVWLASRFGDRKAVFYVTKSSADDLTTLSRMLESGQVRPVIDRCHGITELQAALEYVGAGHTQGKVVVTLFPD